LGFSRIDSRYAATASSVFPCAARTNPRLL
jgi:hypothetical protein